MRKMIGLALGMMLLAGTAYGNGIEELQKGPMLLVTAEYTPYARLIEPELVGLLKKYEVAICLCVRSDQLNDELDRLYAVYEDAEIPILFWPLLPRKDGLYVNKHTTGVYLDYLDTVFAWSEGRHHRIPGVVVDVEPSNYPAPEGAKPEGLLASLKRMLQDLNRASFDASIPEFEKIIAQIHAHDALAVAAAFPFVVDDKRKGAHGWEDLFGGPIASVDWDYIALMMYTSWFVENGKIAGMDWDAAHWVAYDYSVDAKKLWGDKAAVAVGVTSAGEGNEKVIYQSAADIAPALAAVRAAGIRNLGIYDLKGILDSPDPEAWFKVLRDTPPALPKHGKCAAKNFHNLINGAGSLLEMLRK